jgi:hypothetical protein
MVEEYHPLNLGGAAVGLSNAEQMAITFRTVELIGEPVTFSHFVESSFTGGLIFYVIHHTYVPYLRVGGQLIEGEAFQDLASNFPFGTYITTSEWLIFELTDPDGNVESHQRQIFDKIGYEARQGGGTVHLEVDSSTSAQPALNDQSSFTTLVAPSKIAPEAINADYQAMITAIQEGKAAADIAQAIADSGQAVTNQMPELRAAKETMDEVARLSHQMHLFSFAATSDFGVDRIGRSLLIKPYFDTPRLLIASWEQDGTSSRFVSTCAAT